MPCNIFSCLRDCSVEKQGVEDLRKAAHYIEMLIYEELQNGDRSIGGTRRADERSGRTEPTPTLQPAL